MDEDGLFIVLDYNKTCRLCLQTRGLLSDIFDDEFNINDVSLVEQIQSLTTIDMSLDNQLPSVICHTCRHQVEVAYQLRETALRSHQLFTHTIQLDTQHKILDDEKEPIKDSDTKILSDLPQEEDESSRVLEVKREQNEGPVEGTQDEKAVDSTSQLVNTTTKSRRAISSILVCQLCLSQLSTSEEHSQHIASHYATHSQLTPYHVAKKPYSCEMCDVHHQGFSFRNELVIHHREHLGLNPYKCTEPGCDIAFKSKDFLRQHSYTHSDRKYICEQCGAAFRRKSELAQHCIRHEDEGVLYQCALCLMVCKNRFTYRAHLKNHDQGKRFKCVRNGCPKAFFSRSDLEIHERSHTNDKRFKCPMCVCAYISKSQLNRHLRQHVRRKVTKCDKCTLSFNNYTDFCNHRISVHGDWLPFRCEYCKQGYQNERTLERHMSRCKLKEDTDKTADSIMLDHMDVGMGIGVVKDESLGLDTDALQNNSESSFLYIINMDSRDDKSPTQDDQYMIIHDDNT